jgi:hypothetical protein
MRIKFLFVSTLCVVAHTAFSQQSVYEVAAKQVKQRESIVEIRLNDDIQKVLEDGGSYRLYRKEYFRYLRKYSLLIREKLFECYQGECKTPQMQAHYNRKILGLLDLPDYMKDSLLNYRYTEPEVRAAVGDEVAQRDFFERYNKFIATDIKTNDEVKQFLNEKIDLTLLAYIRSEESLKIFLNGLQTNDVYTSESDNETIQVSKFTVLLNSYGLYIGGSALLDEDYYKEFLYVNKEADFDTFHEEYFKQLEAYFKDKHKVDVKINAPYMILGSEFGAIEY